jgi:hypothetical protein
MTRTERRFMEHLAEALAPRVAREVIRQLREEGIVPPLGVSPTSSPPGSGPCGSEG